MREANPHFIEDLVAEEIRRLISEANAKGLTPSVNDVIKKVMFVYPGCGLSRRQVAERDHAGGVSGRCADRDRADAAAGGLDPRHPAAHAQANPGLTLAN